MGVSQTRRLESACVFSQLSSLLSPLPPFGAQVPALLILTDLPETPVASLSQLTCQKGRDPVYAASAYGFHLRGTMQWLRAWALESNRVRLKYCATCTSHLTSLSSIPSSVKWELWGNLPHRTITRGKCGNAHNIRGQSLAHSKCSMQGSSCDRANIWVFLPSKQCALDAQGEVNPH